MSKKTKIMEHSLSLSIEYVSANVTAAQGFCFYITLWAKDLSSPDPEPKLYQTLVRKFRDEMHVHEFKLKPPQQE
ncbi:unnamed protein product [Brassica oleracea]|nr:unnamed protein product [Brassica napus]